MSHELVIKINYDSSWGNSFLSDNVKDTSFIPSESRSGTTVRGGYMSKGEFKKFPGYSAKDGVIFFSEDNYVKMNRRKANTVMSQERGFIASISSMKKEENNYKPRDISNRTVLGVLYRLIGDVRTLEQIDNNYLYKSYFKDIEDEIVFENDIKQVSEEVVFLRNLSGSTDRTSFCGTISSDHPAFTIEDGRNLWKLISHFESVEKNEKLSSSHKGITAIFDWFQTGAILNYAGEITPLSISEILQKTAKIIFGKEEEGLLKNIFETEDIYDNGFKNIEKEGVTTGIEIGLTRFLTLFISKYIDNMVKKGSELEKHLGRTGKIPGISKNNFTPKDFLSNFLPGNKKLVYGNPYIYETIKKGVGKEKSMLTKRSGTLTIRIKADEPRLLEIESLIKEADVSTFYVGKKGLAYVEEVYLI